MTPLPFVFCQQKTSDDFQFFDFCLRDLLELHRLNCLASNGDLSNYHFFRVEYIEDAQLEDAVSIRQ